MIEKLFTSKTRIKIMEYLFFHKEESYLRKIAKELGISPSAVKKEIENLEIIGIIKKQGNKIMLNKSSNILEDLKSILIKTDSVGYPIKKALENANVKFVLIFGSFARGEYNYESDVDLLVIGKVKQEEIFRLLRPVEEEIDREINPVVWSVEEFKKRRNSSFVKDILKKKIIMIMGTENELRRIIGK
jgi:predicted nucleotidyltransferase